MLHPLKSARQLQHDYPMLFTNRSKSLVCALQTCTSSEKGKRPSPPTAASGQSQDGHESLTVCLPGTMTHATGNSFPNLFSAIPHTPGMLPLRISAQPKKKQIEAAADNLRSGLRPFTGLSFTPFQNSQWMPQWVLKPEASFV